MTKNRLTVSKHILVDETLDKKLGQLADASYTNQSSIIRLIQLLKILNIKSYNTYL